ncbi:MAG TPA: PucR family transcriptional regulator ligand-binding domain-containing protein [Pseudonocardia sp.]
MSVTVADLLAVPRLRMSLLAGAAGLDRRITWAHPSDSDHPWDWLTDGELVLRNGESLPVSRAAQLTYLRRLAETGAAGLVIGADQKTEQLHPELLDTAQQLGFPLLWVPYGIAFTTVVRAVADANSHADAARFARTERVYRAVRDSLSGRQRRDLMSVLERELRCRLLLVDGAGAPVLTHHPGRAAQNQDEIAAAVQLAVAEVGGVIPAVLRIDIGGGATAVAVEVPAEELTLLVALGAQPDWVDVELLQHVATAAAVQLASWSMHRGYLRRLGAELLSQLLDDQLDAASAHAGFAETELDPADCVLLAVRAQNPDWDADLHIALSRRAIPSLLLGRAEVLYAMLPDRPEALDTVRRAAGARAAVGISAPVGTARRAPAARREADWAVSVAASAPSRLARYGNQVSLFLLRDLDEAQMVVDRVLGALLEHDRERGSDLVGSLDTFLTCQRSWQRTGRALGVHKQTVLYRMRKVEQLTGRALAETADIAELWVALQARRLLGSGSVPDESVWTRPTSAVPLR